MLKDYTQRNFTVKSVLLSIILAMLLAATNVYLALKIGTTISASIPAAVLAIGVFRLARHYSVFECNLAQTAASAGEGMAAGIAFIVPAMVIFHYWDHFHYWLITIMVIVGGVLGVFLSVPLRRVLLNLPDLKYPEGTAIGNVLKVSASGTNLVKHLLKGIAAGGIVSFLQQGVQLVGSILPLWLKTRGMLFGITLGFNPAAFAAGFIIGPAVSVSLAIGVIIGWVILVPILTHIHGVPHAASNYDAVMDVWTHYLRYVGVGTMLVGGLWTLCKLINPIRHGIMYSLVVLKKKHTITEQERDIPMLFMALGTLVFSCLIFFLLAWIFHHLNLPFGFNLSLAAVIISLFFVMVVGFLLTTVCGYITGVIGSTNNPLSGMIIISVLLLGLIYSTLFHLTGTSHVPAVVALILLVATIIATIANIGAENFQDLKAGKMIGATPWKQQLMLAIGVVASSFVIAPVLQLLYNAYGMGGVFPHPGMDPSQMLAAPQATLMGTIAIGMVTHHMVWQPIFIGIGIAVAVILFDEIVCRRYWRFRLSVLGVGVAIYLPSELMTGMILGGFVHLVLQHLANKRIADKTKRSEVVETANLAACGVVAGSALMGVGLAIPFALAGSANVLTPAFASAHGYSSIFKILGVLAFSGLIYLLMQYRPRKISK